MPSKDKKCDEGIPGGFEFELGIMTHVFYIGLILDLEPIFP